MLAAFRLLVRLAGRDLRTLASLAVNNLFFLVLFLLQGSNPRTMVWTAFPFVVLLGLPLIFASSGDPLQKVPAARLGLWPLTGRKRFILRLLGFGLNPVIWVAVLLLLMKMGLAMALLFVAAIVLVQGAIAGVEYGIRRAPGLQVQRYVPQPLGGIFRLGVRQMLVVLDFYVALVVSVGGLLYRGLGSHVDTAAYPVISIVVALALSTYAQRMFGLDGPAGETRYRLLPLRGWQLLAAKDAAYLGLLLLLLLPSRPLPGLAFALVALAVGRHASLTSSGMQHRWRFVGGNPGIGILQVAAGAGAGFGCEQFGWPVLAAVLVIYAVSLAWGGWLWEKDLGRAYALAKNEQRRRLVKGW